MRLTIPHYYDFGADRERVGGALASPSAWDTLRETDGPFGLPSTRAEWEALAAAPGVAERARDVALVARRHGVHRLCSYGVGVAALELELARCAPELELVCTDFAPRAVARLRALFPEASVVQHDLIADDPVDADLHLLHRVDTEFSDPDLRRILARFRQPVLFVPAALLGPRLILRELFVRFTRRDATRAGWLRSDAAFRALWDNHADVVDLQIGDAPAYLLGAEA